MRLPFLWNAESSCEYIAQKHNKCIWLRWLMMIMVMTMIPWRFSYYDFFPLFFLFLTVVGPETHKDLAFGFFLAVLVALAVPYSSFSQLILIRYFIYIKRARESVKREQYSTRPGLSTKRLILLTWLRWHQRTSSRLYRPVCLCNCHTYEHSLSSDAYVSMIFHFICVYFMT